MVVTAKNHNEKINKKISTRTPTFSSLEKQNTTTIINNNNNNNNYNNNKNNTSNSKENSNMLITIALPKTDLKFNYAAIKEEETSVPKQALLRQNTNLEKYPQKNQIRLLKFKDWKSSRKLESHNSSCVTSFVQNPPMFWTYVTNNCKLRYIFTDFFTGFVFFIILFSFLFRHFTIVDEPQLNLNFYNYSTITRIFSRTGYIDFYKKYFFKHETLRIDLEKRHITWHSKKKSKSLINGRLLYRFLLDPGCCDRIPYNKKFL